MPVSTRLVQTYYSSRSWSSDVLIVVCMHFDSSQHLCLTLVAEHQPVAGLPHGEFIRDMCSVQALGESLSSCTFLLKAAEALWTLNKHGIKFLLTATILLIISLSSTTSFHQLNSSLQCISLNIISLAPEFLILKAAAISKNKIARMFLGHFISKKNRKLHHRGHLRQCEGDDATLNERLQQN